MKRLVIKRAVIFDETGTKKRRKSLPENSSISGKMMICLPSTNCNTYCFLKDLIKGSTWSKNLTFIRIWRGCWIGKNPPRFVSKE